MAAQRSLLERLRHPDPPGRRRLRVPAAEVQQSILENLQRVLNTCQGNCLTDPGYGLPHLTAVRNLIPASLSGLEAAIRATIERNEPRLRNIRVRHNPTDDHGFELRFEIYGVIDDEQERIPVRFETYADEDGRVIVR